MKTQVSSWAQTRVAERGVTSGRGLKESEWGRQCSSLVPALWAGKRQVSVSSSPAWSTSNFRPGIQRVQDSKLTMGLVTEAYWSVGVCLAVGALAGMRWCLWESEALCLLRNPLLSSAASQYASLRPNQANKHSTGQPTPSGLVHRNQELFKSRVWTEEARDGELP